MSANFSSTEENELSPKQHQLIAALVAGNDIKTSAKAIGIAERTAHTWLKQSTFKKAYQEAKQAIFDETLEGLRECTTEAISTLKRNLTAEEPAVQVRAAHILLTQSIQVHKIEQLEQRIAELEEALKASRA